MIYPTREKYLDDCHKYNLIPVFREMRADFETAVSIFMKVKGKILLESVEQGDNVGRYSIIALGKRVTIKLEGQKITISEYNGHGDSLNSVEEDILKNPLEKIRDYFRQFNVPEYPGLPPFFGGALGYLGYETLQYFEDVPVNRSTEYDNIPDGLMIIPEMTVIYDSVKRSVFIAALTMPAANGNPKSCYIDAVKRIVEICTQLAHPVTFPENDIRENQPDNTDTNNNTTPVTHLMEKNDFLEAVNTCKEYIREGEIIQVVFSQKFAMETNASPFELYRTLRVLNPSPYLFFLDFDDFCLIGSSPEVMVRVQDGEILLKPIAGTRHRGQTVSEDSSIAKELLADPKERAEHLMLVDLGRNDVGRVSVPGSVRVTDYMKIEKYSHVMHMVSTIKSELAEEHDVFDVIRAGFPAGTLSGAPKVRAMEIIAQLETEKRGPYGGMIFNMGFNGNLDSAITIRTIVLKGTTAYIQAGAGIVADSIPEKEYEETVNKAQALMVAIERTEHER